VKGGVIAIDGPSASGKSSTARAVAESVGFAHQDSGSLNRGVTLVALREAARRGQAGGDPLAALEPETILRAAEDRGLMLQPDGAGFAAYLEGVPVDPELRGAEVTAHVSAISAVPVIREWINSRLRAMVRAGRDVVVDGRDIGTVVFPDAELKIFLTADPEVRAERRYKQLIEKGISANLRALSRDLQERDARDANRAVAPLVPAPDSQVLDSSALSVEAVVEQIQKRYGERNSAGRG
jgi:cytidylate kinase